MSHISAEVAVGGFYVLYDGDRTPESKVSVTDVIHIISDEVKDGV